MNRWVGRIALVTGASSGIGAGICKELVRQGMVVLGCARNVQRIKDISKQEELIKSPGKLEALKCDISSESDILLMHDEIRSKYGRLDVCINNAIASVDSSLLTGESKDWKYMLEVGILGMCINTQEAVKLMKLNKLEGGQIIQMGSIHGHNKIPPFIKPPGNEQFPWFHTYYGIKCMTRALTEGLRQELKAVDSNIRVATISPGVVETDLLARATSAQVAEAFFSAYKCLQPQDIADAVTYILSTPSYVNVNDIILDPMAYAI